MSYGTFSAPHLAAWRLEAGFDTQQALAEAAHADIRIINALEHNKSALATGASLNKLADAISRGLKERADRLGFPPLPFGVYDLVACSPAERRNQMARGQQLQFPALADLPVPDAQAG